MFRKFVVICCVMVLLTACPESMPEKDVSIRIVNNSEEDIVWLLGLGWLEEWYEITTNPWGEKYDNKLILRGEIYIDRFNSYIARQNLKRGWKKYYLFNLDSVKTIPWKRICDERIILKEVRFDSWEDFERCNFEITYP